MSAPSRAGFCGVVWATGIALLACRSAPVPRAAEPVCPAPAVAAVTVANAPSLDTPPAPGPPPPAPALTVPSGVIVKPLALTKVGTLPAKEPQTVRAVSRADGDAWAIPLSAAAREPIHVVGAKSPTKPWATISSGTLLGAPAPDSGVWIAASAQRIGAFAFPAIERVVRLDAGGRVVNSTAWPKGSFRAAVAASNASGSLWMAGTLAGPLELAGKALEAPKEGRVEALVRIDSSGSVMWASVLPGIAPGSSSALSVGPNGAALVAVQAQPSAEVILVAAAGDGAIRWSKALGPAYGDAPGPSRIELAVTDGAGGHFIAGAVASGVSLDFGDGGLLGVGHFVARVDEQGKLLWARAVADWLWDVTGDQGGSLFVARGDGSTKVSVIELDAAANVVAAWDLALPEPCRAMNATTHLAANAESIQAIVSCQRYDDAHVPRLAVGGPVMFSGRARRR